MKKKIILTLFIFTVLITTLIQAQATEQLDIRRFEAWTVEYEPYRLLIENSVNEYLTISGDDIKPINPGDMLIAVRSKSRKNSLYQLRYGSFIDGFSIIEGNKVGWVLGTTLMQTIAAKEQYYHLDSRIPFQQKDIKPELDFLKTELFWTNTDLLLGLDRSVYKMSSSGGLLFEWGNELMGLPYADAGTMRIGLVTPVFKLGMQLPSLINIGIRPGAEETERLNGGIGGFGAFNYSDLYGEISFLTNTADVVSADPALNKTSNDFISYMDIAGIVYFNYGAPLRKMKGAFQIKPGFSFHRIANRKIKTIADEKKLIYRTIDRAGENIEANPFGYGFFLRFDYASGMGENTYPKFLITTQLNSSTSFLAKLTWNVSESISVPVTVVKYLYEYDYLPDIATHFGIQFRLKSYY